MRRGKVVQAATSRLLSAQLARVQLEQLDDVCGRLERVRDRLVVAVERHSCNELIGDFRKQEGS